MAREDAAGLCLLPELPLKAELALLAKSPQDALAMLPMLLLLLLPVRAHISLMYRKSDYPQAREGHTALQALLESPHLKLHKCHTSIESDGTV